MKILLVEDTPDIAIIVIEQLKKRDHEVVWETTVRAGASALVLHADFDAAIFDMQLPDGIGTTLAAIAPSGLPVCMFTAAPYQAEQELVGDGITDVPVFDKMRFYDLFDWVEGIQTGKEGE
jgi:DNA-binding response OmpR family regulator